MIDIDQFIIPISDSPTRKTKLEVTIIALAYCEGVRKSNFGTIEKNLLIPRVLLNSNKRFCNVVQVAYALEVETDVAGCHRDLEISIPITIASIPLNFVGETSTSDQTYSFAFTPPVHVCDDCEFSR